MSKNQQMTARTLQGLEEVLAEELKALGAANVQVEKRAVVFEGDTELMYKANLHCRTALRILKPIKTYKANNEDKLHKIAMEVEWPKYIKLHQTFAVDAVVNSRYFNHSKYAALKLKDAICDRYRKDTNERPSVDPIEPDISVGLRINDYNITIYLDSSGDSLHKRGYRSEKVRAPLSEVLAAGMILLSDWDKKSPFVDGMCGSGTIAIEAAMIATNTPPGLNRTFAFQNWPDYDQALWERIVADARRQIKEPKAPIVFASDSDRRAVQSTVMNAKRAAMDDVIEAKHCKFQDLQPPEGEGTLIINPPYGERMQPEDINNLYAGIGDALKQHFTGYDAWILSSNKDALKSVGLRTSRRMQLFNGPLECKYHKYEMYQGSRKGD